MTEALSGLRVIDASNSVAGQFCGRLFADNGAAVALAEPPGGSPIRRTGPFAPDGRSTLFAHLNMGKASLLVGDDTAHDRLIDLAACADVLIIDGDQEVTFRFATGRGPRTLCKIAPFGPGMLERWQGSELVYQALSGVMYENGSSRGAAALRGRTSRVLCRRRARLRSVGRNAAWRFRTADRGCGDRRGCVRDVVQPHHAVQLQWGDRGARHPHHSARPCALRGWLGEHLYLRQPLAPCLPRSRAPGPVGRSALCQRGLAAENWRAFTAELDRRLAVRPVDEVVAAGQRERAVVARAMSPLELLSEPQLLARGYWSKNIRPGDLPRLGPMFRMSDTPQQDHGPAPEIGAGGEPMVAGWTPAAKKPATRTARPLDGVRVLDLTTAWSGPMCTRILAALGADVVKVEGPGRIDDWRGPIGGGHPARYPDGAPGERPFDRCYQFNTQNHDKRSLVVDLKDAAGLEIVLALADRADVMIANFSAGTLAPDGTRLGHGASRAMSG